MPKPERAPVHQRAPTVQHALVRLQSRALTTVRTTELIRGQRQEVPLPTNQASEKTRGQYTGLQNYHYLCEV